ncbi:MAG: hypothetical protein IJA54_01710 [Tyzzerella sp.]|nr:hypothetical protein [Tyzzerella sp.]
MIKTTNMLLEELNTYASPNNKIGRMVQAKELVPIVKGLYETDSSTPGYLLAGSIYGPSYLSFDFALGIHGLIPEAVYAFTSATFEKKKKKQYDTPFGLFTYQDVPTQVFYLGVQVKEEGNYAYYIASPEKALCDKLYSVKPVRNRKELEELLFDDLRIDETEFLRMNKNDIMELAEVYHSTNVTLLAQYVRRCF